MNNTLRRQHLAGQQKHTRTYIGSVHYSPCQRQWDAAREGGAAVGERLAKSGSIKEYSAYAWHHLMLEPAQAQQVLHAEADALQASLAASERELWRGLTNEAKLAPRERVLLRERLMRLVTSHLAAQELPSDDALHSALATEILHRCFQYHLKRNAGQSTPGTASRSARTDKFQIKDPFPTHQPAVTKMDLGGMSLIHDKPVRR